MAKVKVQNPKTGETRVLSSLDGNDLVRHCGWNLVQRFDPELTGLSEQQEVQRIIDRGAPAGIDRDEPAEPTLAEMFDGVAKAAEEGPAPVPEFAPEPELFTAPAEESAPASAEPAAPKRGRPPKVREF